MRLADIGRVWEHLAQSPVQSDLIWAQECHRTHARHLMLFGARMAALGHTYEATEAIGILQAEAIKAIARGQLGGVVSWLDYEPIQPRFMADELVDGLARLSLARRAATLFALEAKMGAEDVVDLSWKDLSARTEVPQTGLCQEVLRAQPRHIRINYVFWEFMGPTIAAPLLEFKSGVEHAFMCSWERLQDSYDAMQMIDRRADAASFLGLIDEVQRGQL